MRRSPANELTPVIYNRRLTKHSESTFGETFIPRAKSTAVKKANIMGDRSPKANQKKSGQKQSKANSADARKKAAVASKQAAGKKK